MKNLTESIKTNYFRQGTYSTGMTVLVVCAILIFNLIINEIPVKYTKVDVSPNQLYTLGEQTKDLADTIDQEITLYYICESGSEDQAIAELLEQYEALSKNIKVEKRDPVLNPSFAQQYTDSAVSNNSVIAVSGDRSRFISYDDMYEYEMDYTSYSYTTTGFDGEGQITSAIDYVISDGLPVIYTLEGHGETELDSDMQALIEKQNVEFDTWSLLSEETLPDDISCLMILSPSSDLTETETDKIIEYMEEGGRIFMTTTYSEDEMPQIDRLLETHGVKKQDGVVMDLNSGNYYQGYPMYLLPDIQSHSVTSNLTSSNKYALILTAQGLEILDTEDDSLSVSSLLRTSDSSISKADIANAATYEKEDGDIDGPFEVGVAITKEEGRMVYFTSESIVDYSVDEVVSRGNSELAAGAVSWLCDEEVVTSIPVKSLETEYLTLTSAQTGYWGFTLTALIPGVILIGGGIIWFRRRKK